MTETEIGQRVRFTTDVLGAVLKNGPVRGFTSASYGTGDTGTITAALPDLDHEGQWYAVTPDGDDTVYVPVHVSMFEAIS